uniref:Uncharacterized protein n=1 Tax=Biomphalaria glabrata TaxID=6526 RepID=A0A2C9LWR9_BIOGL
MLLFLPQVMAQSGCPRPSPTFYDAFYDLATGKSRDFAPSIIRVQNIVGVGCNARGVLKLAFSDTDASKKRLLIDLFFTSPNGWVFNLGDSSTNNGFGGDSSTQSNDAELQLVNTALSGFLSDNGGGASAFSTSLPTAYSRLTLVIGNEHTVFIPNGDVSLANYYTNVNWFALNSQLDQSGPVNNDLFLGLNQVIQATTGRTRNKNNNTNTSILFEIPVSLFKKQN